MNADQIEILGTLRSKIRKLMSLYTEEKKYKDILLKEKKELIKKIEEMERYSLDLEEKYDRLKIAKTIANDGEVHDAKIKVNRIVREIDKCIALLNR